MLNYLYSNKGIGLLQIANYYFDNYFLKQTEGCGELLFNLTYISKYITKYEDYLKYVKEYKDERDRLNKEK